MPVQKTSNNKILYAFRVSYHVNVVPRTCNVNVFTWQGFIAFVAFIDIATALRNYVERRSFMSGNEEFTDVKLIEGKTNGLISWGFDFPTNHVQSCPIPKSKIMNRINYRLLLMLQVDSLTLNTVLQNTPQIIGRSFDIPPTTNFELFGMGEMLS